MKHAVHLIPADGIGGVEVAARALQAVRPDRCHVSVLFVAGGPAQTDSTAKYLSPALSVNNPLAWWRALRYLWRQKPEVLVCSLWRTVPVGLLIKLLRPKTRLVFFLHLSSHAHFVDKLLDLPMLLVADVVWADSQATLAARMGRHKKPARVISFITHAVEPPPKTCRLGPRFVFWGRLNRQKGLDRAIGLVAALASLDVDARFEIWGPDDGEKNALEQQAQQAGLKDRVVFKGVTSREALPALAASHCFYLQLSRTEGMAMSVVEAMQLGLVPVVTPVGEMARYCRDNENAVVVNDVEHPAACARQLLALLQDENHYLRLSRNARKTWEKHPLYQDDFCAALEELMEHRG
ncbi:glycosyltransferase family 4 protein [Thiolapillus brandeum]|uniref:Glycosyl transferase family 1 domain-containing protein n=1 Tax=Thiolapillus brandeum TaxID=1076588 RepID=A0A7U6JHD7_9GAMM|nr:glycosyltransferase family 4 protein [Thiolapillus brandeum]BAO43687.1 hypothetical protein TBH_C0749 [Thiolapillus brandeum]